MSQDGGYIPPPDYYKQYTDEAVHDGTARKPPCPPRGPYKMFGETYNVCFIIVRGPCVLGVPHPCLLLTIVLVPTESLRLWSTLNAWVVHLSFTRCATRFVSDYQAILCIGFVKLVVFDQADSWQEVLVLWWSTLNAWLALLPFCRCTTTWYSPGRLE